MSRKKISEFDLTTTLNDSDLVTLVQEDDNRNITVAGLKSNLAETFATDEELSSVSTDISELEETVESNYDDLSSQITEGDEAVTTSLSGTLNEYYEVLTDSIDTLEEKHDDDISSISSTVQEWIEEIDNRSTNDDLESALNRLTVMENTVTALATAISEGEGIEGTVAFHTQPTSTITALTGYYKDTSADALTTSDTLNEALSKLENQVDAIASSSGSLPVICTGESTTPTDSNIYTAAKVKEDYLFKSGDTATGAITFQQGIRGLVSGQSFSSGWDGTGASLYPSSSKWNLEVDNLLVRGSMTVNELDINEIKAVGGDILVSMADMTCTEVEETDEGYKCYFDTQDGTKYNEFIVCDMAICQKYDGSNVKRYWREVTDVGDDYIILSKDICESGSDIPEADDDIILLGHRYDDTESDREYDDRRSAIFITSKGDGAPRITFYKNIDDFTLDGCDTINIGDESKFTGTIVVTSGDTDYQVPVYRGAWNESTTYYYYDEVTYDGSLWVCMSTCTGVEPSEDTDYWQLMVSKGDTGADGADGKDGVDGDDVAKWVQITGDHIFKYEGADYTGDYEPEYCVLTAEVYGIDECTYYWTRSDNTYYGTDQTLEIYPNMLTSQTDQWTCTVTDLSDNSTYYDIVQVAKLCNGAEGDDAYYIDLSNYSASVPFDADGNILIDPEEVYTYVYAYHGTEQIEIDSLTAEFVEGSGEIGLEDHDMFYKVYLTELTTSIACIELTITVEDDVTVTKQWYINQSSNGADGADGSSGETIYLYADSLIFHYGEYSDVPTPEEITLTASSTVENATYTWSWTPAETSDWQTIDGETEKTLTVGYNEYGFAEAYDEVSFRVRIKDTDTLDVYTDMLTINNIYDGDSAFHGILTNQQMVINANSDGSVDDDEWDKATCNTQLWLGGDEIPSDEYDIKINDVYDNNEETLQETENDDEYEKTLAVTNPEAIDNDYLSYSWKISFIYNGSYVDTATLYLVKNTVGADGTDGSTGATGATGYSVHTIYCLSNSTPTRPTFSSRISSSGASQGIFTWFPDALYSSTYLTWSSSAYYDTDSSKYVSGIVVDDDGVSRVWTTPIVCSGIDGVDGSDGTSVTEVTMYYCITDDQINAPTVGTDEWTSDYDEITSNEHYQESGYYVWAVMYVTFSDGESSWTTPYMSTGAQGATGEQGALGVSLNYRGEWSSTSTYYWSISDEGNYRDVVYDSDTSSYYMVANSDTDKGGGGYGLTNIEPSEDDGTNWTQLSSFENIATGLLFAEKATIAGIDFYNNIIQSQSGVWYLDGRSTSYSNRYPLMAFGAGVVTSGVTSIESSTGIGNAVCIGVDSTRYGIVTVGTGVLDSETVEVDEDTGEGYGDTSQSVAGMTSYGTGSGEVRFWCGCPYGNTTDNTNTRYYAPFRVYQSGRIVASNATITGKIVATDAEFTGSVTMDEENFSNWHIPGIIGIVHIEDNDLTYDIFYSTGGFTISSISRPSAGYTKIAHNIGHKNYTVLFMGRTTSTGEYDDNSSWLGNVRICLALNNTTYFYSTDTDNNEHYIGGDNEGIDLVFVSYNIDS